MCYNSRMKEARAEHKPYPTDLTDAQWSEIEPLYSGMRNRKWSKRELTNAVLYIVKTGCQWRQLPHDFPPYQTVYSFFSRGAKSGLWEEILAHLVEKTRKDAGKSAEPHYALIDSQSVKTVADNEARGIDGGKNKRAQASCCRRYDGLLAEHRGSCCQYARHEIGHSGGAESLRKVSVNSSLLYRCRLSRHFYQRSKATVPVQGRHFRENQAS